MRLQHDVPSPCQELCLPHCLTFCLTSVAFQKASNVIYQLLLCIAGRSCHDPVEPRLCPSQGSLQEVPCVYASCQSKLFFAYSEILAHALQIDDDMFGPGTTAPAAGGAVKKGLLDNYDDVEGYYNFQVGPAFLWPSPKSSMRNSASAASNCLSPRLTRKWFHNHTDGMLIPLLGQSYACQSS